MQIQANSCESTLKRTLTDDDAAMDTQSSENFISPNKRSNNINVSSDIDNSSMIPTAVLSREFLLNSPIPDRPSRACLVKVSVCIEYYYKNQMLSVLNTFFFYPLDL